MNRGVDNEDAAEQKAETKQEVKGKKQAKLKKREGKAALKTLNLAQPTILLNPLAMRYKKNKILDELVKN